MLHFGSVHDPQMHFVCVCVFLFSWAQRIAVRGQVRVSIRKLLLTSDFPFSLQDWARDLSLFSILGPYWASRPWFSRARLSTSFQSFAEHIAFLLGHIAATCLGLPSAHHIPARGAARWTLAPSTPRSPYELVNGVYPLMGIMSIIHNSLELGIHYDTLYYFQTQPHSFIGYNML